MKAAAVAATQQSTTKKCVEDVLVLSEGGDGMAAHLAAGSTMVEVVTRAAGMRTGLQQ
jgi:hypothetical protein